MAHNKEEYKLQCILKFKYNCNLNEKLSQGLEASHERGSRIYTLIQISEENGDQLAQELKSELTKDPKSRKRTSSEELAQTSHPKRIKRSAHIHFC